MRERTTRWQSAGRWRSRRAARSPSLTRTDAVLARAEELAPKVAAARDDTAMAALVVGEALAKTDCEQCGWPTCRAYADAIAGGRERALHKCEPGGAKSMRDANLLVQLRAGKTPSEAAAHATAATLRQHR